MSSPSQRPSPSAAATESAPFHNNLHYQEVLATLRYGIACRKGLIVLVGDSGSGKTTILEQLARAAEPSIECIFAAAPEANFTELLRLLLQHLEAGPEPRSGLSMMQRCKWLLRSLLDRDRIAVLIIDDAHRLRDETLEYLLYNFFGGAPAAREENLLQVVLAGSAELKDKLAEPRLRTLIPRSELWLRLEPLSERQIAPYVENRLRAFGRPADTFDRTALQRTFDYTAGNPQLVNMLCDRALELPPSSPQGKITSETVALAARQLNLALTRKAKPPQPGFDRPDESERDDTFHFEPPAPDSVETEPASSGYTFDDLRPRARKGRNRKALPLLLGLLLLGAGAAWLQSQGGRARLSQWLGEQEGVTPGVERQPNPAPVLDEPPPPDVPAPPAETALPPAASTPKREEAAETFAPVRAERSREKSPATAAKEPPKTAPSAAPRSARAQDAAERDKVETQIYRAIENRAIMGVKVSMVGNVVYLDGQVATLRQRRAAEQAARSVAGVERVRNRLSVAGY